MASRNRRGHAAATSPNSSIGHPGNDLRWWHRASWSPSDVEARLAIAKAEGDAEGAVHISSFATAHNGLAAVWHLVVSEKEWHRRGEEEAAPPTDRVKLRFGLRLANFSDTPPSVLENLTLRLVGSFKMAVETTKGRQTKLIGKRGDLGARPICWAGGSFTLEVGASTEGWLSVSLSLDQKNWSAEALALKLSEPQSPPDELKAELFAEVSGDGTAGFGDVVIVGRDGAELKAHHLILRRASAFFDAAANFKTGQATEDADPGRVELKGFGISAIRSALELVYLGRLSAHLDAEAAEEILQLLDLFQLQRNAAGLVAVLDGKLVGLLGKPTSASSEKLSLFLRLAEMQPRLRLLRNRLSTHFSARIDEFHRVFRESVSAELGKEMRVLSDLRHAAAGGSGGDAPGPGTTEAED